MVTQTIIICDSLGNSSIWHMTTSLLEAFFWSIHLDSQEMDPETKAYV